MHFQTWFCLLIHIEEKSTRFSIYSDFWKISLFASLSFNLISLFITMRVHKREYHSVIYPSREKTIGFTCSFVYISFLSWRSSSSVHCAEFVPNKWIWHKWAIPRNSVVVARSYFVVTAFTEKPNDQWLIFECKCHSLNDTT